MEQYHHFHHWDLFHHHYYYRHVRSTAEAATVLDGMTASLYTFAADEAGTKIH